MKIVHIINEFHNDLNYEENITTRYQRKLGHEIYIITSKKFFAGLFSGIEIQRNKDNVVIIYMPVLLRLHTHIIYSLYLKKILRRVKPDIVHAHTTCHSFSLQCSFYKDILNFKYFIDCHEFFHDGHILNSKNIVKKLFFHFYFFFNKLFANYAFNKASKIFSVADVCTDYLQNNFNYCSSKLYKYNLFVDTLHFSKQDTNSLDTETRNFIKNKFVIGFSGFITPRKNLHLYLSVLSKLGSEFSFLFFIKISDEDYISFNNLLHKLKLKDRVLVYRDPPNSLIPHLLSCIDLGLFLSNNSISILEYLSCSVPVICADMQLSHFVTPKCGKIIPKNSVTDAVDCINYYHNHPLIRKEHSINARIHIENSYSAEKQVNDLTELYLK